MNSAQHYSLCFYATKFWNYSMHFTIFCLVWEINMKITREYEKFRKVENAFLATFLYTAWANEKWIKLKSFLHNFFFFNQ